MKRQFFNCWCSAFFWLACFTLVNFLFADEWKPRHDLVSHTGVMNLTELPPPKEVFFGGPDYPNDQEAWLTGLKAWRENRRVLLRYNGSEYVRPNLAWTRQAFSQVQIIIWDRSLYDPARADYTVDRFLAETENRIGPIDAVLIWHVYPNLGVDDRNQFDLLRDLPGGLTGIHHLVEEFHNHGIKVFFPYLIWDTGTRNEGPNPAIVMSQLMKEVGADGVNFDTLESVPHEFKRMSDATGHPLVLEPQFQPRDESIDWTTVSWNDWVTWEGEQYPFVPMVSKNKWMEPRHSVFVTDRYTRDKTDSLQHAFFNDEGYATLENLWGFWNGDTARDAEALLRFTRIERVMAEYLQDTDWEPHTPMIQHGVFASRFCANHGAFWAIVNRNEFEVEGAQITTDYMPGKHYYDLWHGNELQPVVSDGKATISFELESLGYGAILETSERVTQPQLLQLIDFMSKRSQRSLSSYPREWKAEPQTIVEMPPTRLAMSAPPNMVRIPESDFDFAVSGIEIEGGNGPGIDIQYPWEAEPRRNHRHRLHIHSFYIDRTPVTNAEFKRFLDDTRYHPSDDHNFLRDWQNGTYPSGWEDKPVTWVSIEDARAYAQWSGKRLPHEWEWQFSAQSADGRAYPWGGNWNSEALPDVDRGPKMRAPTDVNAFPRGASPFGVLDLVGNISQWTDEYRDPHTRSAIVRGGSFYEPAGSIWYFPQTYRLDEHQKYLLMSPGRDRTATIGFRCVVDAE